MIGYKVLTRDQFGRLRSLTCPPEGCITYEVGNFVSPIEGNGPLCVLTDKDDALDAGLTRDAEVFSCEYIPETVQTKVWTTNLYNRGLVFSTELATIKLNRHWINTTLASSVKLLERVA